MLFSTASDARTFKSQRRTAEDHILDIGEQEMSLDFSDSVSVSPGVLIRELDGERVVLNLENETYYGLDQSGSCFWSALMNASSIKSACDQLIQEFAVSANELHHDMERFVNELLDNGLVYISNEDNPSALNSTSG